MYDQAVYAEKVFGRRGIKCGLYWIRTIRQLADYPVKVMLCLLYAF